MDATTVEAVETLRAGGIDSLLLKGPALATMLYDPGEERAWDDADLLVPPREHRLAAELLAGIGYRARISDPLERGSVPHAVVMVRPRPAGGFDAIDLHLSFAGVQAPPEELWASLTGEPDRIELFGRPVSVPAASARLALVALHAAAHGRAHQRSRRDLERAVTRFSGSDWAEAADLAGRWRALDLFVVGLRLDPGGEALLEELGIDFEPAVAARMRGEGMPRAQRSLEQLARARGWRRRVRIARRKVFPSTEVMRTWKPIARRGRPGLAIAYLWRPPWLLWQLAIAARAYRRASAKRRAGGRVGNG